MQIVFHLCVIWYRILKFKDHRRLLYEQWKKILENRIILEGDVFDFLTQFTCSMTCICHPLLQDTRLLYSHFSEVYIQYMWRESNMRVGY